MHQWPFVEHVRYGVGFALLTFVKMRCSLSQTSGTNLFNSVSIRFVTECRLDRSLYLHTIGELVLPQSSQKRQVLVISATTCAESSLLVYAAGHSILAILLGASSSAVLSWSSASSKLDDPRLARYIALRHVVALTLFLMTTFSLQFYSRRPHPLDGVAGSSRMQSPTSAESRHPASVVQSKAETVGSSAVRDREAYVGIILWPKKQTHPRLIAPSAKSWNQKLPGNQPSNPLLIPFEGVYWFFREPNVEPLRDLDKLQAPLKCLTSTRRTHVRFPWRHTKISAVLLGWSAVEEFTS